MRAKISSKVHILMSNFGENGRGSNADRRRNNADVRGATMCQWLMMCECGEVFPARSEITIISGINIKLTTNFGGS